MIIIWHHFMSSNVGSENWGVHHMPSYITPPKLGDYGDIFWFYTSLLDGDWGNSWIISAHVCTCIYSLYAYVWVYIINIHLLSLQESDIAKISSNPKTLLSLRFQFLMIWTLPLVVTGNSRSHPMVSRIFLAKVQEETCPKPPKWWL